VCDLFPDDLTEWGDADGDGIGDNQDLVITQMKISTRPAEEALQVGHHWLLRRQAAAAGVLSPQPPAGGRPWIGT
jgi:hypothetical protein